MSQRRVVDRDEIQGLQSTNAFSNAKMNCSFRFVQYKKPPMASTWGEFSVGMGRQGSGLNMTQLSPIYNHFGVLCRIGMVI